MFINNIIFNNYVTTINVVQNHFCNKSELNNKPISIQKTYIVKLYVLQCYYIMFTILQYYNIHNICFYCISCITIELIIVF